MKFRLWTSNLEDGFRVHDDSFMSLGLQISLLFKLKKKFVHVFEIKDQSKIRSRSVYI